MVHISWMQLVVLLLHSAFPGMFPQVIGPADHWGMCTALHKTKPWLNVWIVFHCGSVRLVGYVSTFHLCIEIEKKTHWFETQTKMALLNFLTFNHYLNLRLTSLHFTNKLLRKQIPNQTSKKSVKSASIRLNLLWRRTVRLMYCLQQTFSKRKNSDSYFSYCCWICNEKNINGILEMETQLALIEKLNRMG